MTGKNIFRAQPGERPSCVQWGLTFCENTHFFLCFVFCLGQYCHRGFFRVAKMNNPSLLFAGPQGLSSLSYDIIQIKSHFCLFESVLLMQILITSHPLISIKVTGLCGKETELFTLVIRLRPKTADSCLWALMLVTQVQLSVVAVF